MALFIPWVVRNDDRPGTERTRTSRGLGKVVRETAGQKGWHLSLGHSVVPTKCTRQNSIRIRAIDERASFANDIYWGQVENVGDDANTTSEPPSHQLRTRRRPGTDATHPIANGEKLDTTVCALPMWIAKSTEARSRSLRRGT